MKITASQLRRIIKEEVQKVIKESSGSVLDDVYEAWGHSGMSPEEVAEFRPELSKRSIAMAVRKEYGETPDGYAAFVADFSDMLGDDEEMASMTADEIWSPKYGR